MILGQSSRLRTGTYDPGASACVDVRRRVGGPASAESWVATTRRPVADRTGLSVSASTSPPAAPTCTEARRIRPPPSPRLERTPSSFGALRACTTASAIRSASCSSGSSAEPTASLRCTRRTGAGSDELRSAEALPLGDLESSGTVVSRAWSNFRSVAACKLRVTRRRSVAEVPAGTFGVLAEHVLGDQDLVHLVGAIGNS